jgi:hypothetical protein
MKEKELAEVELKQRKSVIVCHQRCESSCRHNSKHIDSRQLVWVVRAQVKIRGDREEIERIG